MLFYKTKKREKRKGKEKELKSSLQHYLSQWTFLLHLPQVPRPKIWREWSEFHGLNL